MTLSGGSDGSGASYQWYAGGCGSGSVLGTGNSLSVSPLTTTTYYVRRVGTTSCTQTTACASVTVTVQPIPNSSYTVSGTTSICDGQSTSITLSGSQVGMDYELFLNGTATGTVISGTGSALSFNNITAAGTYTVVGTAVSTYCPGNYTMSGSATITVKPAPVVTAGSDVTICDGDSIQLNGSVTLPSGTIVYSLTSSGGNYPLEKWMSITTGPNGTGTLVWSQGNGTIGNGSGLLTNQLIDLSAYAGWTLYLNAYDQYDDTWDGTLYTFSLGGSTILNNGGLTPSDGADNDASSGWDATAEELETSESFTCLLYTSDAADE